MSKKNPNRYDLSDFSKTERTMIGTAVYLGTKDSVKTKWDGAVLITEASPRKVLATIRAIVRETYQAELDGDVRPREE